MTPWRICPKLAKQVCDRPGQIYRRMTLVLAAAVHGRPTGSQWVLAQANNDMALPRVDQMPALAG
ncbi:hypothetical protein AWV80_40800 [Cupriavidus sp. UYMU48A]|nr:hypothetical protein AWV80_40800 [Cupriavidus sp. UYMU48A]